MTDTQPAPAHEHLWLLVPCTTPTCNGHYRLRNGLPHGIWDCTRCPSTVTRTELDTDTTGDLLRTHGGALCRGIPPNTPLTHHTWTATGHPRTEPTTAHDLYDDLRRRTDLAPWTIERLLLHATATGRGEHTTDHGLQHVVTRP